MNTNEMNRRSFFKKAAAVSAATALPNFWIHAAGKTSVPTMPRVSQNDKVNIAFIGIGQQGGGIAKILYKTGLCNVVALCDVNMGAPKTQELMNMFPKARRFQDFREMFDVMGSRIDAVTVGLPDHTHFPPTMEAMARGIHVYVEKPMARTFQECELMMAAEKKYGVVTQMGNQGHSQDNYYQFRAWKNAGIIKNVTAVTAHMNNPRRWHKWDPKIQAYPAAEKLPKTMNWDCWLGAVHHHDYQKDFIDGQWRCWYDFGMGALGDWGAHTMDTVHEFLELGLPTEIDPVYLKDHNPFFFPMSTTLKFKFPERNKMPALTLTWQDGLDNIPEVPSDFGTSALASDIPIAGDTKIQPTKLNPGKEIYTDTFRFKGGSHGSKLFIMGEQGKEMEGKLPTWETGMPSHYESFLLACMNRAKTTSPFSIAGPLSQVFCLGVLAQRFGTKLIFDREKKQITNNPMADIMLRGDAPRPGWEQYYKV